MNYRDDPRFKADKSAQRDMDSMKTFETWKKDSGCKVAQQVANRIDYVVDGGKGESDFIY